MSTLPNGLTLLSNHMPWVETISVGAFTNAGALNETEANNGVAHFLEHMAFKGTQRRNALEIAEEMENLGAFMNAYTSREQTSYYVKCMKEHLPKAVDFLADILQHSTFDATEMERERGVILQEINHYEETPDDAVFDHLQDAAFKNQPMGRKILGPKENVKNMTPDDLRHFINTYYGGNTMVLSVAGNATHEDLEKLAAEHFSNLSTKNITAPEKPAYTGGMHLDERPLEQAHITLGYQGMEYSHPQRHAARVWATVLGGGMASRLFQEVREKRGLAYTVSAFNHSYRSAGLFGVYAGTAAKDVPELMTVLGSELQRATENLTSEEVARAKTQIKSSILMSLESTSSRMDQAASEFFTYGKTIDVQEAIANIDAITPEAAAQAGAAILATPKTLAAVGSKSALKSLS